MHLKHLKNIYAGLLKLIYWIVAFLGFTLIIDVFSNVISRYFLHTAIAWSEEYARFAFIWISFLGAVLATEKAEHMNLDFLTNMLPRKVGAFLVLTANLIVLILLVLMLKGGVETSIASWDWASTALEIPLGIIYGIVPICCGLMFFQVLARIPGLIKKLVAEDKGRYVDC